MARLLAERLHGAVRPPVLAAALLLSITGCSAPSPSATPPPAPASNPAEAITAPATAAPTPGRFPLASDPDTLPNPPPRAVRGGPPVRVAPDESSTAISGLYYDAPLPLLEEHVAADGTRWYRTRLWGVLDGWIRAEHVTIDQGDPVRPFWEGSAPKLPTPGASPSQELVALGSTNSEVVLRTGPGTDYRSQRILLSGTQVAVRAWATDDGSRAWYRVTVGQAEGWVYAAAVDLQFADPQRPLTDGRPLAARIAGKGMWLPQPLLEMADVQQLVAAAQQLGLSHIFVEAGETARGFYARQEVARLLPAAHTAGLAVIAWVTTSLYDLPRDVALSVEIATFRTADGHAFDGIAADIEQNLDLDAVKAYAEITRVRLGDDALLVGVVYPAGSWFGRAHPIYATLARSFNAQAPMAYWGDEERTYSPTEVYEFVAGAVRDLQAAVGPGYPVHVIGQMYDAFGRNGTGLYSPGRRETTAALRAAQDAGAIGVSFFQWGTATPEEWAALRDFAWKAQPPQP